MYNGLGLRQMRVFNTTLLGKWCGKMLVDIGRLWNRMMVARYGEENGRLRAGVVHRGGWR
jgi:hypothetical protein